MSHERLVVCYVEQQSRWLLKVIRDWNNFQIGAATMLCTIYISLGIMFVNHDPNWSRIE